MKRKKLTKEQKQLVLKEKFSGTGHYIYENRTSGYLNLPKPCSDGRRVIPPSGKFEGDSYFMTLVRPPQSLLRFIEEVKKEEQVSEKKLILDQPDMVTAKGTVEHVVDDNAPVQRINDSVENGKKPDILLNEGPVDGVEIIPG